MQQNYTIKVFNSFYNHNLVHHWKHIQEESGCFPQMYYEWCELWWRFRSGGRVLHIVSIIDNNNKIVGIAPLCIEKKIGIHILRSIPIQFGDFYSFIIENGEETDNIALFIIGYLKTFSDWQIVYMSKVNNNSIIWKIIYKGDFRVKHLSTIHIAAFINVSFNKYLTTLTSKTRSEYFSKLKQLKEIGVVNLECIEDVNGYLKNLKNIKSIINARWINNYTRPPSDNYYLLLSEVATMLSNKGKFKLYLLKVNNEIISFQWGFTHQGIYYDWISSINPKFKKYYPGILIIGNIISDLINQNYKQLNFCAGDYSYKKRWATPKAASTIYDLFAADNSMLARLYLKYRINWRDKLKLFYHYLLQYPWIRAINRRIRSKK